MTSSYWCVNCQIPLIQKKCGIYEKQKHENDLRNLYTQSHTVVDFPSRVKPVGKQEYEMYKEIYIKQVSFDVEANDSTRKDVEARFPKILYRSRNLLYSELSKGVAHFRLTLFHDDQKPEWKLTSRYLEVKELYNQTRFQRSDSLINGYFWEDPKYRQKLTDGNTVGLGRLEDAAVKFIQRVAKKKKNHEIFTSFSGGKDSAVTAYLVKKALGQVKLLFSNTDIEYEETVEYVRGINEKHTDLFGDVIEVKSKNKFLDFCNILGPPSRTMRWCCSTQKASPVNQFYSTLSKNVLSFDGIRREESNARAEYPREHQNTKLQRQYSAYPILDWTEIEIWLYTVWRNIPLNPLYKEGFSRIGCWACPNNGLFDTLLFEKIRPEKADVWYNALERFRRRITENHDHNYDYGWIDSGKWKGRRVKYHNQLIGAISVELTEDFDITETEDAFTEFNDEMKTEELFDNESKPCLHAESMVINFDYELGEEAFEFLKVFGGSQRISFGNRTLVRIESKKVHLEYFEGSKKLKYKILSRKKINKLRLRGRLIREVNKYLNCIKCAACVGLCPKGAITVVDDKFMVDSLKCIHCLKCTSGDLLQMGCVALHYKPDRLLVDQEVNKSGQNNKKAIILGYEPQLSSV